MIKEGERGHPTLRFFSLPIAGFQNDKRRRRGRRRPGRFRVEARNDGKGRGFQMTGKGTWFVGAPIDTLRHSKGTRRPSDIHNSEVQTASRASGMVTF